jgi:hypothetical protein
MRLNKRIPIVALAAATIVSMVPGTATAAKSVKTKIVVADFRCFEGADAGLVCEAVGGLNSNKSACSGNRNMQVLWNGDKVAATKSDGSIHAWEFDDFPIPGAGTLKIVALTKHSGDIKCKQAKRSYTVDSQGQLSPNRTAA